MQELPNIFLTGFMGSGKTTLGKQLADLLKFRCIDLDTYIETKEGKTISSIFENQGELVFRKLETQHLNEVLKSTLPTVISLGGGTVCFDDNVKRIKQNGTLVYLELGADELAERLTKDKAQRPILKDFSGAALQAEIKKILNARIYFYSQAHITVNGLNLTATYLLNKISEFHQKNNS